MAISYGRLAAVLLSASALAPAHASETVTYRYDELGRLTLVSSSGTVNNGTVTSTGYDPEGNRTNVTVSTGGGAAASPPDPANVPASAAVRTSRIGAGHEA